MKNGIAVFHCDLKRRGLKQTRAHRFDADLAQPQFAAGIPRKGSHVVARVH
jgi:hypothetical protein